VRTIFFFLFLFSLFGFCCRTILDKETLALEVLRLFLSGLAIQCLSFLFFVFQFFFFWCSKSGQCGILYSNSYVQVATHKK
jgi:hypothetical protein